jgi:hypothetical protein
VADDFVARGVEDGRLALDDGYERVAAVADAVQHIADVRAALSPSSASCAADSKGLGGAVPGSVMHLHLAIAARSSSSCASIAVIGVLGCGSNRC